MNLASVIVDHDASRTALIDGDDVITYGQLRSRTGGVQRLLADLGIGRGDQVVVAAGNEPSFVYAALAVLGVGAVVVPVKPTSPVPELVRKLSVVDPAVILIGDASQWMLSHTGELGAPIVNLAELDTAELDGDGTSSVEVVPCDASQLAFLLMTSGVSGEPKVAMLSHGNLDWVQEYVCAPDGVTADDVLLGALPFAHIFGLNVVLLAGLRAGAAIVLQRRFDVDGSLTLVRQHGVTSLTGAPPMWQRWAVAEAPDDSLATIRLATSGAAALPIEVFLAIRDRYGIEIAEGYGLTETSPVVTSSRGVPVKPTSVGKPIPGVEMLLVEPDGTPVEVGDTGEIVVRGPGIFQGYLNSPEETDAVLTDDGWFWTGDVGVFDDDGYLHLVDRIKDLIIVSGFNVFPSEVESILMDHPAVRGAVVVGTPHGETGESVVAHVSGDVSAEELDTFVRSQLSRYKCPTEYHFVDEIPVAATGKLIRRELRT